VLVLVLVLVIVLVIGCYSVLSGSEMVLNFIAIGF
jgi:hypothetical protein